MSYQLIKTPHGHFALFDVAKARIVRTFGNVAAFAEFKAELERAKAFAAARLEGQLVASDHPEQAYGDAAVTYEEAVKATQTVHRQLSERVSELRDGAWLEFDKHGESPREVSMAPVMPSELRIPPGEQTVDTEH